MDESSGAAEGDERGLLSCSLESLFHCEDYKQFVEKLFLRQYMTGEVSVSEG